MSDIFDIKRFGKFLTYELNNAKASCGLSILVMCLLPAILFTFFEIFSFIFTRQFQPLNMEVKKICFTFCILILVMSIPAKMYGMDAGEIAVGKKADLVIFDPEEEWTVTDSFHSKANNSPFIGRTVTGKVKMTICKGQVVYSHR